MSNLSDVNKTPKPRDAVRLSPTGKDPQGERLPEETGNCKRDRGKPQRKQAHSLRAARQAQSAAAALRSGRQEGTPPVRQTPPTRRCGAAGGEVRACP
ncbi:hypothetical protein CBM2623_A280036 [Cupriavidus taiwanensis]|nr:hypothetical protein CBM2623_A280036 [Cupriavidus taiwanensis]